MSIRYICYICLISIIDCRLYLIMGYICVHERRIYPKRNRQVQTYISKLMTNKTQARTQWYPTLKRTDVCVIYHTRYEYLYYIYMYMPIYIYIQAAFSGLIHLRQLPHTITEYLPLTMVCSKRPYRTDMQVRCGRIRPKWHFYLEYRYN